MSQIYTQLLKRKRKNTTTDMQLIRWGYAQQLIAISDIQLTCLTESVNQGQINFTGRGLKLGLQLVLQ